MNNDIKYKKLCNDYNSCKSILDEVILRKSSILGYKLKECKRKFIDIKKNITIAINAKQNQLNELRILRDSVDNRLNEINSSLETISIRRDIWVLIISILFSGTIAIIPFFFPSNANEKIEQKLDKLIILQEQNNKNINYKDFKSVTNNYNMNDSKDCNKKIKK